MNTELEVKVIKKYISTEKQGRYALFVSSVKNRDKLIKDLPHFKHFKWEMFEKVQGEILSIVTGRLNLASINSKTCCVISENRDIDGEVVNTEIAFKSIIGYGMATILIFGSAEFIYYEDEGPNRRFMSKIVS